MDHIMENIRNRRSVRTFDQRSILSQDMEKICTFLKNIDNPYGLEIQFKLLKNMSTPVIVGTDLYLGAKMKKAEHHNEAFGYSFEKFVLYAQSLGIGTTWIGGTMNRADFEEKMELSSDEIMPCISPLGYPASKLSMREMMMRKGIKADERLAFHQLFFHDDFNQTLSQQNAGKLLIPLEAIRLAPSAVNKQPWRILVVEDMVHFYLQRSKGLQGGELDMQMIDMGIALCHFELASHEQGIQTKFTIREPENINHDGMEYVASYQVVL